MLIGIIGAMEVEVQALKDLMDNAGLYYKYRSCRRIVGGTENR